ncbi:MAG TPA: hypothetical protein ENF48_03715 [Desulfobacteraceae bacterium]|nr:MAG: hypothetical protein DRH76_01040 [Deltaproteobacteria bacterium]HDI59458.1 hypothetical protein [Desulfobacteraceae bacterium]
MEINELWAKEAEDRIDAYGQGKLKVVSLEKVLQKLMAKKRKNKEATEWYQKKVVPIYRKCTRPKITVNWKRPTTCGPENTTSMSLHSVIRFQPLPRACLENT